METQGKALDDDNWKNGKYCLQEKEEQKKIQVEAQKKKEEEKAEEGEAVEAPNIKTEEDFFFPQPVSIFSTLLSTSLSQSLS